MRKKHSALIELGKAIRKSRIAKGYSQEDFAHDVGLDRTYIGGIERGERNIGVMNLLKIAKTLKVEVGELFPAIKHIRID